MPRIRPPPSLSCPYPQPSADILCKSNVSTLGMSYLVHVSYGVWIPTFYFTWHRHRHPYLHIHAPELTQPFFFQDLELFFAVITACRTACFALRPNSVRPRSQLCAAPQLTSYFSIFFLFMSHAPYSPVEVRLCGSVRWAVELAVEVRQCWQCPLSSGACGWGPAAHWHLELAVAVRQCPLSSGACVWGPAVPSAIWSSRLRCGRAHWDPELALEVRQCPLRSSIRSWDAKLPEEKKEKEEKHLWWNLEILTWQAGKYIILS